MDLPAARFSTGTISLRTVETEEDAEWLCWACEVARPRIVLSAAIVSLCRIRIT